MTIRASCGHVLSEEEDFGFQVAVKSYSRDCSLAVAYMTLCTKCRDEYEKEGLILHTEQEENDYLEITNE